MTAFSEAPTPSQLFQYYLLDTKNFQPNVFTTTIPGINDGVAPTATGPNHDLPTLGGLRVVVEPKPGLPTDPNDPGSFVDMFTDISGLFVINNESGWYEGWMIDDVTVPDVAAPRADGHAAFGTTTAADAAALAKMGDYHNKPGAVFTTDGKAPHEPSATDHWPDNVSNLVPIQLSLGAYNATQQSDLHSYWELNQYTNWVPPAYELPFTGGMPGTFEKGKIGALSSIVPGSGPAGVKNKPQVQRPAVPARDRVQPRRGHPGNQRRPAFAPLRAQPARVGAQRRHRASEPAGADVDPAGRRQPLDRPGGLGVRGAAGSPPVAPRVASTGNERSRRVVPGITRVVPPGTRVVPSSTHLPEPGR